MVVGWSMSSRITSDLVCSALRMAIAIRLPFANDLLAHSDQGSQYASHQHTKILRAFGISCSMSRKGNCWDNSVVESVFASLKKDLVHHTVFETRAQAKSKIFDHIEVFYNKVRTHSTLDYLSPYEFEQANKIQLIAA